MTPESPVVSFDEWIKELDKLFAAEFGGFHHDDFPDYLWHDEWSSDCEPDESFQEWRLITEDGQAF